MSPLASLAVPSLKDVADQTVALYSALLDDRLTSEATTISGERLRSPDNDKEADPQTLERTR